jgi:PIN domain nuclease of toxin-antitoxin system
MKLLVDTHVFLSFISDDGRLSARSLAALINPGNELYLSVAAIWEIVTKYQIGKLPLPSPVSSFVEQEVGKNRMRTLPILESHVFRLLQLPLIHRDPFDRIMIAQSLEETLPIISSDRALSRYSVEIVW